MTVSWEDLSCELVDRLGIGLDVTWSLLFTAQSGALALSLIAPLDEDLSLSDASRVMGEALEELEQLRPELAAGGLAADLGPVHLDGLTYYRTAITGLLGTALDVVAIMLRDQAQDLDTPELLALASFVALVGSARQLVVTGPLP